ncbi:MAG TPA: hypothetical protein VGB00_03835 [Pyrinomonadaceae bacterium]|jgi:hypothetical protein
MSLDIFLSVGSTYNDEQEEFVKTIEKYLESNGLSSKTLGRSVFSSEQPLKAVEACMKKCAGTIILAFERTCIENGKEKRGSPKEIALNNINLPTVWNQIEAAMSYSLGLPLLVLVEHGLKNEGLLEKGYDWYVKEISLDKSTLLEPEFVGVFFDWKKRVEETKARIENSPEKENAEVVVDDLTIGQIFKSLKPAHLWTIGVSIVTILTGVAAAAFNLGKMFGK